MTESTNPTTVNTARHSLDLWLTMWNSDGEIARQICADDFRIHFAVTERDGSTPADDIRSAEDFAKYLDWWHEQNPGVVFTRISDAIDGDHGRLLWDIEAGGARAKITAVMAEEHRAPVQEILGTMQVIDAVAATDDVVPLGMLSDVIAARRVVRLTYLGEDKNGGPDPATSTVRDVETMGLLRAGDAWLLTGWCRLRDAIRGFRIERITRLEILAEVPPPRDPALLRADLARWPTRRLA